MTATGRCAPAGTAAPWEEREQIAVTAAEYIGLSLVNLRLRMALQRAGLPD